MQNFNLSSLFLTPGVDTSWVVVIAIAVFVVAAAAGVALGMYFKKKSFEKKQGDIQKLTEKMLDDARRESNSLKKEAIYEAKEQAKQYRDEVEREIKEKKVEIQRQENRLNQKEDNLDKKEEALAKRNEETTRQQNALKEKHLEMDKKLEDIASQHDKMIEEFEKISQMSKEEAKKQLIDAITDEAKRDAAGMVKDIEAEARENGERKAKEIVSLAIQKCSTEQATEITVSVVPLPSDDMKARIIGMAAN